MLASSSTVQSRSGDRTFFFFDAVHSFMKTHEILAVDFETGIIFSYLRCITAVFGTSDIVNRVRGIGIGPLRCVVTQPNTVTKTAISTAVLPRLFMFPPHGGRGGKHRTRCPPPAIVSSVSFRVINGCYGRNRFQTYDVGKKDNQSRMPVFFRDISDNGSDLVLQLPSAVAGWMGARS